MAVNATDNNTETKKATPPPHPDVHKAADVPKPATPADLADKLRDSTTVADARQASKDHLQRVTTENPTVAGLHVESANGDTVTLNGKGQIDKVAKAGGKESLDISWNGNKATSIKDKDGGEWKSTDGVKFTLDGKTKILEINKSNFNVEFKDAPADVKLGGRPGDPPAATPSEAGAVRLQVRGQTPDLPQYLDLTQPVNSRGGARPGPIDQTPASVPPPAEKAAITKAPGAPAPSPDVAAPAQPKPPTLDQATLLKTAEELHDALNQKKWLGLADDPDKNKVFNLLEPLGQADREALAKVYHDHFDAKGGPDSLMKDLKGKLGGEGNADFRRAEAIMERQDGRTNDAGALMVAITHAKSDKEQGNAEIRAVLETLNSKQIDQLAQDFQKDYGKSYQDALKGANLTDATTAALPILEKGVDHKDANDVKSLAKIAIDKQDPHLLAEALRGDSPAAVQARTDLQNDAQFKDKLADAFPSSASVDLQVNGGDPKSLPFESRVDQVALDYLKEGNISLATITSENTGKWLFDNKDNIELAARNATDKERQDFTLGRQISDGTKANDGSPQAKAAVDFYNKIHDAFKQGGNDREVSTWEDSLINGRSTIVTDLAKTQSDGWGPLSFGKGHSKQDIMSKAENLSEADWKLLSDKTKGPEFRRELEDSLKTYADPGETKRIMDLIDQKAAAPDYASAQKIHRSLADTISDNKGHVFLGMGTSYDDKNITQNLTTLSPADAQNYKNNPAFRESVDDFVNKNLNPDEKVLAQSVLARVAQDGKPPTLTASDTFLQDKIKGAQPEKLVQDAESALKDPAFKARMNVPDDQLTAGEKQIKADIQDAASSAYYKNNPAPYEGDYGSAPDDRGGQISKDLFSNGGLSLQDKLELGYSKSSLIADIAKAPEQERAALMPSLKPEEQQVVNAVVANHGEMTLADKMRLYVTGGDGNYADFKADLSKLDYSQVQALKNDYAAKYKSDLDNDYLAKVDPKERSQYESMLTPSASDGRQTFYDNLHKQLSDSGGSMDGTALTMQRAVDQSASSLEQYQRIYETLPKDKQEALDKYFNDSLEQRQQSKEKLAEIATTAVITAAALAAAPFTAGASVALVASLAFAAGAATKTIMTAAIEGNDFPWTPENIAKNVVLGGVNAALNFAGGGEVVGALESIGGQVAGDVVKDVAVTSLKDGGEKALQEGVTQLIAKGGEDLSETEVKALAERVAASGATAEEKAAVAQSIEKAVAAHSSEVTDLSAQVEQSTLAVLGKQVVSSSFIGGASNAASELAAAPFSPNGLDVKELVTSTLTGMAVGAVMPIGLHAFQGVRQLTAGVSRETVTVDGVIKDVAVVHPPKAGEPDFVIQRGDTEITMGPGSKPVALQEGDRFKLIDDTAPAPKPEAAPVVKVTEGDVTSVPTPEKPLPAAEHKGVAEARSEQPKAADDLHPGEAVRPGEVVHPELAKPVPPTQELDQAAVNKLWDQQASADGVYKFQKGYYEANLAQVDAAANPNGIIFSSSEKAIKVSQDVTLPGGQVLKAGTELPNGVQLSPGHIEVGADGSKTLTGVKLTTPEEGVRMPDGSTLKSSEVPSMKIEGGAEAKPNQYIIQRASTDDAGRPRIDTYAQSPETMAKKWVPVPGKPGVFSPNIGNAGPVEMVKIPDGMRVKFMASYGEDVSNKEAAYLVKSGNGHYIITERDLRETYIGADLAGDARMNAMLKDASEKAGVEVPRAARPEVPTPAVEKAPDPAKVERPAVAERVTAVPEVPVGKVNSDGFTQLTAEETASMFEARAAAGEKFTFQKADVAPGQKGYYQVDARQLNATDYPNGLRVPTTESPIVVAKEVHLADGSVIPAGTKLPNGVQLDGATIKTPPAGIKLENGTVLKDGMQLPKDAEVRGGQQTNPNDWLITRTKVDSAGNTTYDVYTPPDSNFGQRWKPVEGQPGQYSPRAVPTDMVYLPPGKYEIPTSWGTAKGEGPAFLAKYGDGDYNIITGKDLSETYKGPTDARSAAKLDEITAKVNAPIEPAAKVESFEVNSAGERINSRGERVNAKGQILDSQGRPVNDSGQLIDSRDLPLSKEFPNYSEEQKLLGRQKVESELADWKTIDGKPVKQEFDALTDKLGMSQAQKDEILNGLAAVRDHGAGMQGIDSEQVVNWNHTEREFGAAVQYADRNGFTKEQTQDLLLAAMWSDGSKSKFNFTTHNLDGALAFEQYAKNNLKDFSPERVAQIQQAIREHQVAPPEFMSMIYGGAIMGGKPPLTEEQMKTLGGLRAKMANPFKPGTELIDVPGGPAGAKALKLSPEEQALLRRSGQDYWFVPSPENSWNKVSRGLIDADGIDNYAGPGGLSKIIKLRGPDKAPIFRDRSARFVNPEDPSEISSQESWMRSQRDFLGTPEKGNFGAATDETRAYVKEVSRDAEQHIQAAQKRIDEWINSVEGRTELNLPSPTEQPQVKIPGWTGTPEHPDLLNPGHVGNTPEELSRARKIWDRYGDELGREQRVDLQPLDTTYEPVMKPEIPSPEYKFSGVYDGPVDPRDAIRLNTALAKQQKDFNDSIDAIVAGKPTQGKVPDTAEVLEKLRAIAFSDKASELPSTSLMKLYTTFRDKSDYEDMIRLYNSSPNEEFKKFPIVKEYLAVAYNKTGSPGKALDIVQSIEKDATNAANPRPELMNGEVYGAEAKAHVIRQDKTEKLLSAVEGGDEAKITAARAEYAKAYDLAADAPIPSVEALKAQAHEEFTASSEAYTKGFHVNYEYYPGINATWSNLALGDLKNARNLAELTRYAAVREGGLERGNYWTSMTMLESGLVSGLSNKDIDATVARIFRGNEIPKGQLDSTFDAWKTRVVPALEKMQSNPELADDAKAMLERFNYAEAKLKDAIANPSASAKTSGGGLGDTLIERSHNYRGQSVYDAEVVKNNFGFGGIISDTSITRADREQFSKLLNGTSVKDLMTSLGGDPSTLPSFIGDHTRLADIQDPEEFIATAQKIVRQNFGNDAKKLEIIDGLDHKALYDKPIESLNEASGIPPSRDGRVGFDSRTSLSAEFAKGLGDCRHHAQAMQLLYDMWQGGKLNDFLRQAETAVSPAERAQALAKFSELERTQLRTLDVTVNAPIEVKGAYQPIRPDAATNLPADRSFVADDKVNYIEDHTMNILVKRDADGHFVSGRFADSFYNDTYKWSNGAIDNITTKPDGKGIQFSGGMLNGVQGADNFQTPVTLELAVYSGDRTKIAANDPGLIFERGLPVANFEMMNAIKNRSQITSQLTAITNYLHDDEIH